MKLAAVVFATAIIIIYFSGIKTRKEGLSRFFGSDIRWGLRFADKLIDFCHEKEFTPSIRFFDGRVTKILSPSKKLTVIYNGNGFSVVDENSELLIYKAAFNDKESFKFRWAKNEKYLVFINARDKDDFFKPDVYITDLQYKKTIYLASATHSDCVTGW